MKYSKKIFFIIFSVITISAMTDIFGQSVRRKSINTIAPSPSMRLYMESLPKEDIDLYFGKIIEIEKDTAIVRVTAPSKMRDRTPVYYACDTAMRPTAILSDMRIAHKTCAAFKIENGKAEVGDSVMVKHIAQK